MFCSQNSTALAFSSCMRGQYLETFSRKHIYVRPMLASWSEALPINKFGPGTIFQTTLVDPLVPEFSTGYNCCQVTQHLLFLIWVFLFFQSFPITLRFEDWFRFVASLRGLARPSLYLHCNHVQSLDFRQAPHGVLY